jgi:hypothetical protein
MSYTTDNLCKTILFIGSIFRFEAQQFPVDVSLYQYDPSFLSKHFVHNNGVTRTNLT